MDTCPHCGDEYKEIASHWAHSSSCDYPEIPVELLDYWRGVLITRGSITNPYGGRNSRIQFNLRDKKIVSELKNASGIFGTDTVRKRDQSDRDFTHVEFDYSEYYEWTTISHPGISESALDSTKIVSEEHALIGLMTVSGYLSEVGYAIHCSKEEAETILSDLENFSPNSNEQDDGYRVRFPQSVDIEGLKDRKLFGWWN